MSEKRALLSHKGVMVSGSQRVDQDVSGNFGQVSAFALPRSDVHPPVI